MKRAKNGELYASPASLSDLPDARDSAGIVFHTIRLGGETPLIADKVSIMDIEAKF